MPLDVCVNHDLTSLYDAQTSEEELFGNISHPEALDEFLDVLGEKVQLKGFNG